MVCPFFTAASDGQRVVYLTQVAGSDFQKPRRLTRINPQFDRYVMGASRLIEWRSMDGRRLQGALLLPAKYEEGKSTPWSFTSRACYELLELKNSHFARKLLASGMPKRTEGA